MSIYPLYDGSRSSNFGITSSVFPKNSLDFIPFQAISNQDPFTFKPFIPGADNYCSNSTCPYPQHNGELINFSPAWLARFFWRAKKFSYDLNMTGYSFSGTVGGPSAEYDAAATATGIYDDSSATGFNAYFSQTPLQRAYNAIFEGRQMTVSGEANGTLTQISTDSDGHSVTDYIPITAAPAQIKCSLLVETLGKDLVFYPFLEVYINLGIFIFSSAKGATTPKIGTITIDGQAIDIFNYTNTGTTTSGTITGTININDEWP